MVNVNVVVLAGTLATHPVVRVRPDGSEVTELRLRCGDMGEHELPLAVVVEAAEMDEQLPPLAEGDELLVLGKLVRRFYRSGAGARSIAEVVASGIKNLTMAEVEREEPA